jgi:hypothetical protein
LINVSKLGAANIATFSFLQRHYLQSFETFFFATLLPFGAKKKKTGKGSNITGR